MPEQRMDPVETINVLAAQGRIELPIPPRPPSLMDAIATAGVNKLPMLWELFERQQKMEAEKAFNQAMALVQERMQPVLKEAKNPHTNSMYARLVDIDKAIRPVYSEVGFSLTFNSGPASSPSGVMVCCDLRHVGGHTKVYQLEGQIDNIGAKGSPTKTMIHGLGSTVSYLRRYLTVMIFNIPLADDDDGNGDHEQGEPVYQHGGWEGSGSQAEADAVGRQRISDLEQRQTDLKAGRRPKTAEPPLEEGLKASIAVITPAENIGKEAPKVAPKVTSKNYKMLEAFGELKKGFQAMGKEDIYYRILKEYGKAKSNEFTPAERKNAVACYKAMGKVYGTMMEREKRITQIPTALRFRDWAHVQECDPPEEGQILVADKFYEFCEEAGNWRLVE